MTNLHNIRNEAEKIRLSGAEKSAMRASIFGTPTPVVLHRSSYVFLSPRYLVPLFVVLVVFIGGGTTSAAQGALPGDLLYPVKVSINETVEVALAPTPAAKAEVQVRLAERRVEEAQKLSSQGRLNKKTAETLTVDFDEHAAQAIALAGPEPEEEITATAAATAPAPAEPEESSAPAQATMMFQATIEASTTEIIATPKQEQEQPSLKKSKDRRGSLRESLRIQSDILQELKTRASETELQNER